LSRGWKTGINFSGKNSSAHSAIKKGARETRGAAMSASIERAPPTLSRLVALASTPLIL